MGRLLLDSGSKPGLMTSVDLRACKIEILIVVEVTRVKEREEIQTSRDYPGFYITPWRTSP
jgi:hypothetical protein